MGAVWAIAFGSAGIGTMRCSGTTSTRKRMCRRPPFVLGYDIADRSAAGPQFGRVPTPITRRMMIRILETLHEVGFVLHHEDFN